MRSLLYVPADNSRFIAKAHTRGADAVILDLEDAVLPENKDEARAALGASIASARQDGAKVLVRINGDFATACDDLSAALAGGADGIYVAKAGFDHITRLDDFLDHAGDAVRSLGFIAMIEHPAALFEAERIAAHERVIGLTVGGEDLALALGATPSAQTLRIPKLTVHYAAKAHGKLSLGLFGTVADYADTRAIAEAADEAFAHGFDGASCVHPSAVPLLNAGFSPSVDELEWAQAVLDAARDEKKGAFVLNGRMIDAPILSRAKAVLRRARGGRL